MAWWQYQEMSALQLGCSDESADASMHVITCDLMHEVASTLYHMRVVEGGSKGGGCM